MLNPALGSSLTNPSDRSSPARERALRLADRSLCVGAVLAGIALLLVVWFGVVRLTVPPRTWALLITLGLAGLAAISFPLWRQRLYRRVPAPRLLVLVVALAAPLACVEVLANLFDPGGYLYFAQCQRYFAGQTYDGVLPDHVHPPNYQLGFPWGQVTTTSEGWRGPAREVEKPARTLRILGLGDSVLFSWGVDDADALDRRLEEGLQAGLPGDGSWDQVEVINTGNGSFNSLDELLVLRSRGLDYQPDAVFVLVIGNDFYDRPPYVDQVDWLQTHGAQPDVLKALRLAQVERPPLRGPETGRGLFLTISYLLNRSFLIVQGARVMQGLTSGEAGVTAPGGEGPQPRAPNQAPSPVGTPTESPVGTPAESPAGTPAGSPAGTPAGSPAPTPAFAPPSPSALATDGLGQAYPYLVQSLAALREIRATCDAAGVPLVVFTFTDNLADPRLDAYLREHVGGRVVSLRYPEDRQAVVNSATDPHWNPSGINYFAAEMTPHLLQAVVDPGSPGD